jgi:hypothetical protein
MTLSKTTLFGALFLLAGPAALAAAPGQTEASGCLAIVATHATISKIDAVTGTDIFSGELLQTSRDGQLTIQCKTVRLGLGPDSSMRVFQSGTETSVEVERGIVAYSTGGQSENLALYGLDVKIVPDTKQPTIGQVDVGSDCELSVQSTKGTAAVTSGKDTKIVEESKAYDVTPKLGVDYSDDWRPTLADYPEFPSQAKYHDSHHHVACAAAAEEQDAVAKNLTGAGVFRSVAIAGALAGGGIIIWHIESESQYTPTH